MGLLVDGQWHDKDPRPADDGAYVRQESVFRNWVTSDGAAGTSGDSGFKAEPGRYHLYVSYACPWAHRALIFRKLKGLETIIDVSYVHWLLEDHGWTFEPDAKGIVGDKLFGFQYAHQLYTKADPHYSGRVTVPILWDKKRNTIVSNESADIIRMFNSAFDGVGAAEGDYYPQALRDEIDTVNDRIYHSLNNGVYKAGFATTQSAYDEAIAPLFETLDWLEDTLAAKRFLLGDQVTEADWRLFPTLLRFDPVYAVHFKCSRKRIVDYQHLWAYARALYQWSGIADTINMDHARKHYYLSHKDVNPSGVLPVAPQVDWLAPHGR